jgi:hypothetical protein
MEQPAVEYESGSAKVIPDRGDLVNRNTDKVNQEYSRNLNKVAMTYGELISNTDPHIFKKSESYKPKLLRIDTKNWMWRFKVGDWIVRVKAFKRGRATNLRKLNVRISCSCPYWRWQGPEHWAKENDYLYGKPRGTASLPVIKDPASKHWVCKHVAAVLRFTKDYFVRPKKSPLKKLGALDRYLPDSLDDVQFEFVPEPSTERVALRHIAKRRLKWK